MSHFEAMAPIVHAAVLCCRWHWYGKTYCGKVDLLSDAWVRHNFKEEFLQFFTSGLWSGKAKKQASLSDVRYVPPTECFNHIHEGNSSARPARSATGQPPIAFQQKDTDCCALFSLCSCLQACATRFMCLG